MPYGTPIGYGGGGGATTSIIFRPGGASSGNIINNAADVATAIAAAHGAVDVWIDDAFAACIIPAGVLWDFHGFGRVLGRTTFPTLGIQEGGQILHLNTIQNVNILCDCTATPSFDYGTEYPAVPTLQIQFATLTLSAACTLAPFQVPAGGGLGLESFSQTQFDNSLAPTVPFVALLPGGAGPGSGGSLGFTVLQNAFPEDTPVTLVSGDTTTTLEYLTDDTGLPEPLWTLFTGASSVVEIGPSKPLHLTFADSTETLPAAPFTQVFIDSSGGQPTFNLPAGSLLQDGWKFLFSDNSPGFGAGTGGAWAISTPQLLTTDGSLVQSCTTPMTATIGFSLPPMNGGYAELTWNATDQIWYVTRSSLVIFTSGLTAARPTAVLTSNDIGVPYFDKNLGFPVFWNGAGWVNAAGVPS